MITGLCDRIYRETMCCCRDMLQSVFIYIIVHSVQLSSGSDENSSIRCRLSRKSFHSGFHRYCFCVLC